jgi:hypothetical protein
VQSFSMFFGNLFSETASGTTRRGRVGQPQPDEGFGG